jgi:protein-tyrosine-phosphatase
MQRWRLVYVCSGNCCRSPLAEALTRQIAGERFEVASCGVAPAGYIHPLTLETLAARGCSANGLASKGTAELADASFDLAITLCEQAALCCPEPVNARVRSTWPLPDPSQVDGPPEAQLEACMRIADRMALKVQQLTALVADPMPIDVLQQRIDAIADL